MKKIVPKVFFTVFLCALFLWVLPAYALEIIYPIFDLGSCHTKEECKIYCDDTLHIKACATFAEKNGLVNKKEREVAKKFAETLVTAGGPGGCRSKESCLLYCSVIKNRNECAAFARNITISDVSHSTTT